MFLLGRTNSPRRLSLVAKKIFFALYGLLLAIVMQTNVGIAYAEGECLQACTPCTTPEGEISKKYDCSINFESMFDVFDNEQVRVWGYAPPWMTVIVNRVDTYPDAQMTTPVASTETGFNGFFAFYDQNPPVEVAQVQYVLYVMNGNQVVCKSSVNMNLMPAAYEPLPSESVVVDPPGSEYIYNNGDSISDMSVFTNSIQANGSSFTGTLNFSGGTNNGQVFVNNGELDQSTTNITYTVIVSVTNNVTFVQTPVEPKIKESIRRDDSDQHSRGDVPAPYTIQQAIVTILWAAYDLLMDLWFVVGVVMAVGGSFVACWILFRHRLFW